MCNSPVAAYLLCKFVLPNFFVRENLKRRFAALCVSGLTWIFTSWGSSEICCTWWHWKVLFKTCDCELNAFILAGIKCRFLSWLIKFRVWVLQSLLPFPVVITITRQHKWVSETLNVMIFILRSAENSCDAPPAFCCYCDVKGNLSFHCPIASDDFLTVFGWLSLEGVENGEFCITRVRVSCPQATAEVQCRLKVGI